MKSIQKAVQIWFSTIVLLLMSVNVWAETNAVIETNLGNIELVLDEKKAPKTVQNFVEYAQSGFYNGTIFHRVINGFMIQGGGFTSLLLPKKTNQPIENEAFNGLKNKRGTIAMARTSDPHSASSQFFINTENNPSLDFTSKTVDGYGYTVFGEVKSGMDVVDKIAQTRTTISRGMRDVPMQPIVIKQVRISQK